jgi:hypothetical protein
MCSDIIVEGSNVNWYIRKVLKKINKKITVIILFDVVLNYQNEPITTDKI